MTIPSMFAREDPQALEIWQKSTVAIAGAGGLGSVVAVSLARVGIGRLIIADFDVIEPTNLNRQQYFQDQVGMAKVLALQENLHRINPHSQYLMHHALVTEDNIVDLFGEADIMVEAFDRADQKEMLIEAWQLLFPDKPIIAASGLAGWGKTDLLHVHQSGNLYVCGDEETELERNHTPLAPRVGIVANMQANIVLELLMEIHK
ncbi:MAG TPA: sulfur carrier protein ThiS adenylyltransferase ThiF [Candidatus Cloacimonadota bacterium]|nr:sulfur carrier protein ThiS adenylyltransferase ThiF [Candidatus Cloacimonadota bacterium]HPT72969.1 sulfur carrier protein ThiS adenylyltransferase ThiF [Candidatus Cloacimonadota bacterium]